MIRSKEELKARDSYLNQLIAFQDTEPVQGSNRNKTMRKIPSFETYEKTSA